jgi:hypothetical protein
MEQKTTAGGDAGSGRVNEGATAAAAAAPARNQDTPDAAAQTPAEPIKYVAVGEQFVGWFNDKLNALTRPTITLGTKQAEVIKLHPDGRLECEVAGERSQNEPTFVAFDMTHFEQLMRKITALGL